ncbi:MAG TPA: hypothetical protein EYP85_13775 [Armatimonadetes bacterium]|nr:hypothetical protein [Armatimonadota bacterium]
MNVKRTLIALFGGAIILGLIVADNQSPWHDAPLLLLLIGGFLEGLQELTNLWERRGVHLPISTFNLVGMLVLLFTYYFRDEKGSDLVLLIATILLAVLTLVFTTTLITYGTEKRLRAAGWDFLVGLLGTAYLSGTLSYALLLEYLPRQVTAITRNGAHLVALLLLATWLGVGAAHGADVLAARQRQRERGPVWSEGGELVPTPLGMIVRLLVTSGVFYATVGQGFGWDYSQAVALGLFVGVASHLGERVWAKLKRFCSATVGGERLDLKPEMAEATQGNLSPPLRVIEGGTSSEREEVLFWARWPQWGSVWEYLAGAFLVFPVAFYSLLWLL